MNKLKLIFNPVFTLQGMCVLVLTQLMACSTLNSLLYPEEAVTEVASDSNKQDSIVYSSSTAVNVSEETSEEVSTSEGASEANRNAVRMRSSGILYRRHNPEADLNRVMDGSLFDTNSSLGFYFSHNQLKKVSDILIVKVGLEINEFLRTKIKNALSKKYGDSVWETGEPNTMSSASGVKETGAKDKDPNAKPTAVGGGISNTRQLASGGSVGLDVKNGNNPKTINMDANNVDIGDITVRIAKDLGRGVYEVGGEKNIFIYNKKYVMSLLGTVRSEDIAADGTIASEKISDSRIEFKK